MNALTLSIIASLGYGICAPFAKMAFKNGMHANGFSLLYGLILVAISLPTIYSGGMRMLFPSNPALWYGIISTIICAVGFKAQTDASAMPTSLLALVSIIAATYPLVSATILLPFMGEAGKIIVPKFLAGSVLIIAGGYLVSTSIK
ncbi:hypothetical protein A3I18_02270 [Candidatus Campbellbacteria bacterium RIFCSPLOWO2_02_FULL_35_11]|uniref:EamA domain-containing protein n=1 Tax=Candidatus Campbellbacteria bacterium RIFCSPLOWO2_02_FULL_35_11 TaxID=1797581 RepID=A0A1F5ERX3_9BACT|nr:MAG: hypothetical protein A3I18_02270 [Candidatus Campbellbacteria bacterium RIFCSPLOWO2_02_FULL_35_11]